ncbi:uncharacterized protein RHOBADRAFT_41674 [Rhodotorula graminis WP1]|uniref:BTB domain-containing protein n=1 Tax=Rhodotorula graminis (strain WP1) TaxID=578459 RepID=A0A194SAD1_RHOGW|nr:uncharacterized protein RHOBADRAFT_41674 [Rhodotorula graminis WP1]KPV77678.1 hypothetical protein RHOBADRAFT_41674 [Rhodotorula graminis WP1]
MIKLDWGHNGVFRPIQTMSYSAAHLPAREPNGQRVSVGHRLDIEPGTLGTAKMASESAYDPARHRQYRLTYKVHRVGLFSSTTSAHIAPLLSELNTTALPPHVRLFFPALDGRPDAELWTTEHLLATSSTYFRDLLHTGHAETVTIGVKRARTRSSTVEQAAASRRLLYKAPIAKQLSEDSDLETDALIFRGKLGQVPPAPHDPLEDAEFPYKQFTIEGAAYTTYRAILLYLSTGFIQFAPLSSSFATAAEPGEARAASLLAACQKDANLPAPASPQSTYHLAGILGLELLQWLALRFLYDTALTASSAPGELFSELARDDVEWRKVVIRWIIERWDEVEGSQEWKQMMERVETGEIDGAAPTMVEVLRLVAKRQYANS